MNTDVPIHAKVRCDDGAVGTSEALVLDPRRRLDSHVVVRERLWPNTERLVPVGLIDRTTEEEIHLRCSVAEAKRQEPFIKTRFVEAPWFDGDALDPMFAPYGAAYIWAYPYPKQKLPVAEEQIPAGELAIHRGSDVDATDGTVGRVESFLVDGEDHITHVVVRSGHLIRREFAIGVSDVTDVDTDRIKLRLSRREVEHLPKAPFHELSRLRSIDDRDVRTVSTPDVAS